MSNFSDKTKEQYIKELSETLSQLETYKVRYFYIFTMAKLGLIDDGKGGAAE